MTLAPFVRLQRRVTPRGDREGGAAITQAHEHALRAASNAVSMTTGRACAGTIDDDGTIRLRLLPEPPAVESAV